MSQPSGRRGVREGWPTSKFGVDPEDGHTFAAYDSYLRQHCGTTLPEQIELVGGPGPKAKPLLPCSVPGCPNLATHGSSEYARLQGGRAYCEEHKGGPQAPKPMNCSVPGCTNFATRSSAASARRGGRNKPYCEAHKGGATAAKPMNCSVPGCTNLATSYSATSARRGESKPYCKEHRGGVREPLASCCTPGCTNPATRASSKRARLRGGKAYCEAHKNNSRTVKPLVPCSVDGCGAMATKVSGLTFLRGVIKRPYCEEHKGGVPTRAHCSVDGCPNFATISSADNAKRRGNKPYCEAHKGGKHRHGEEAA